MGRSTGECLQRNLQPNPALSGLCRSPFHLSGQDDKGRDSVIVDYLAFKILDRQVLYKKKMALNQIHREQCLTIKVID